MLDSPSGSCAMFQDAQKELALTSHDWHMDVGTPHRCTVDAQGEAANYAADLLKVSGEEDNTATQGCAPPSPHVTTVQGISVRDFANEKRNRIVQAAVQVRDREGMSPQQARVDGAGLESVPQNGRGSLDELQGRDTCQHTISQNVRPPSPLSTPAAGRRGAQAAVNGNNSENDLRKESGKATGCFSVSNFSKQLLSNLGKLVDTECMPWRKIRLGDSERRSKPLAQSSSKLFQQETLNSEQDAARAQEIAQLLVEFVHSRGGCVDLSDIEEFYGGAPRDARPCVYRAGQSRTHVGILVPVSTSLCSCV
jgi:hypothetical protein